MINTLLQVHTQVKCTGFITLLSISPLIGQSEKVKEASVHESAAHTQKAHQEVHAPASQWVLIYDPCSVTI